MCKVPLVVVSFYYFFHWCCFHHIYKCNACEFMLFHLSYLLTLTCEGNPWVSGDRGHPSDFCELAWVTSPSDILSPWLLSFLLVRSPKRVVLPGEVMKSTSWNDDQGQWVCPVHRLCPLEGNSGLGARGTSREWQMGEENPERGKYLAKGPEVGMIMAVKDLKDLHSWAKGVLGNI